MNNPTEGICPSRAIPLAGMARNFSIVAPTLFAAVLLSGEDAAGANCIDNGQLYIGISDSPHEGISCTNISNYSILLEDGASISTTKGRGISLTGGGDISIATNPRGGFSRISSNKDIGMGEVEGYHAISVVGSGPDTPGTLDISVTDVWALGEGANAIRVKRYRGDINISSAGTIRVDGSKPAFGILVDNESLRNPDSSEYWTTVRVHDINSNASEAADGTADIAALKIVTSGGVTVESNGHIHTKGNYSNGVHINQFIRMDTKDPVSIRVNDITTEGIGSHGVIVNTVNYNQNISRINVSVTGRITTGDQSSHGVAVGGLNTDVIVRIEESGSVVMQKSAPTGGPYAVIVSKDGDPPVQSATLTNLGLIDGDVLLSSCNDPVFTNHGTLRSHKEVMLVRPSGCSGDAGLLRNHGVFEFGQKDTISEVVLTGNLELYDSSILSFDVDWANNTADKLTIGGTALLRGRILINSLSLPTDNRKIAILDATSGFSGTAELTVTQSLFINYTLEFQDAQTGKDTLYLSASFDPQPDGLNRNQRNVLIEIGESISTSTSIADAYLDIVNHMEIEELRYDLDSFGNEIAGAAIQSTYHVARAVAGLMPDCKPQNSLSPLRVCSWVTGELDRRFRSRAWEQRGFSVSGYNVGTGFAVHSDESNHHAGLGLVWAQSNLTLDSFALAESQILSARAHFDGTYGRFKYSVVAIATSGSYQIARSVPDGGSITTSMGRLEGRSIGLKGTVSWSVVFGDVRVDPIAEFDFFRVKGKPYGERGAGDLSLEVHSTVTDIAAAGIGIQLQSDPVHVAGVDMVPSFRGILNRIVDGTIEVESDFRGGAGTFLSTTSLLPVTLDMEISGAFRSNSGKLLGNLGLQTAMADGGKIARWALNGNLVIRF